MRFVYGFGFETPAQRANNAAKGWDDEDSAAFLIDGGSEHEALEWGRTVAEAFFKWLYQDADESWAGGRYADYIEVEAESQWTAEQRADLIAVQVGQMPDLTLISAHRTPPARRNRAR